MEGIFAVNKPIGVTSHDIVNMVRRKTGVTRVGHGGTLDPLAEGVLVIAVGRENTKLLDEYVKGEKEYVAEIYLGETSTTDDREGDKKVVNKEIKPNFEEVKKELKHFEGTISQIPPLYSSIKLQGKPAHRRMRKGENITLKAREVFVKEVEVLDYEYPVIKLRIATGSGVYIRSIARDLGEKLGTGGYLLSLIRTRVNTFKLENALEITSLKASSFQ